MRTGKSLGVMLVPNGTRVHSRKQYHQIACDPCLVARKIMKAMIIPKALQRWWQKSKKHQKQVQMRSQKVANM
jgi:hypothetical protein